jgi:hypothetical protein
LQRETLYIRVATSAWLSELQLLSPTIVKKLSRGAGCGRIQRLRFEVGAIPEPRPQVPDAPPVLAPEETRDLPQTIVEALDSVEDLDLKERIRKIVSLRRRDEDE